MRWSLFFLISVGRGKALREVSPERGEELMNWALDLAGEAPFAIKTTEAPSYRRIALKRMRSSAPSALEMKSSSIYQGFQIRDGHGIVFVSSRGEVFSLWISAADSRQRGCGIPGRHLPQFSSVSIATFGRQL